MAMVKLASEIIAGSLMTIPMDGKLQGGGGEWTEQFSPCRKEITF